MIACGLGTARADEAVRVVKALGAHRYVAGRMHLVHALAFASAAPEHADVLAEGRLWAVGVVADASLDLASRPVGIATSNVADARFRARAFRPDRRVGGIALQNARPFSDNGEVASMGGGSFSSPPF